MASSINASTTAGVVTTADTSGVLNIQTAGTTAISIDASQAVSFTNAPTVTGGTANGVAYLNGSKALTTGSVLTFDGTKLSIGSGNSTAAGLTAGYFGASGYGAIWSTSVTPSTTNFAFLTNGTSTVLNGSGGVNFQVGNVDKVVVGSAGLAAAGSMSVGGATPTTSGAGITFPATQSASSDANTLDDYEEGTYTPTASNFSTTGTVTVTGSYIKIGNIIHFSVKFASTGTIGFSTSALITTPFTVKQATGNITMRVASNSASFNGNQSGAQCNTDEAAQARFFVGNFTTTSAGQVLIFAGTFEQH